MIVPKRAAILLDRIMVALHHALEDGDQEGVRRINELYKDSKAAPHKNVHLSKDFQSKFVPNFNLEGIAEIYLFTNVNSRIHKLNLNLQMKTNHPAIWTCGTSTIATKRTINSAMTW